MFERFTERARQVIVLAQESARTRKHNYIGTEHLLVGLASETDSLAAQVLRSFDITPEGATADLVQAVGEGEEVITGQIPFTPRSKKVLEMALREALSLGHNYIGTEHVLLALLREGEGVGARILNDRAVDVHRMREAILRDLGRPKPAPKPKGETFWVWHKHGPAMTVEAEDFDQAAKGYAEMNPGCKDIYVAAAARHFRVSTTVQDVAA